MPNASLDILWGNKEIFSTFKPREGVKALLGPRRSFLYFAKTEVPTFELI